MLIEAVSDGKKQSIEQHCVMLETSGVHRHDLILLLRLDRIEKVPILVETIVDFLMFLTPPTSESS